MTIVYLLVFSLWFIGFFRYLTSLKKLDKYRIENGSMIFGHLYTGLSDMGSDTHFLNNLWSGKAIEDHEDQVLTELLNDSKTMLRLQIYYSIMVFLFLIFMSQL